ncbi:AbrB family transcriptional regulator [Breoghania sp. JC706]|uniref:AbrB family transcriptional regulator n=1 Tax=Breoghania sp. JC706 TaxID=3117732 RepID=UPI00300A2D4B
MESETPRDVRPDTQISADPVGFRPPPPRNGSPLRWAGLAALSFVLVALLELTGLPAAILLGAMVAGIVAALTNGGMYVPRLPYLVAQALIGCMIARTLELPVLQEIARDWPVFAGGVLSVILASALLGWSLARLKVLPGSTAIWGSSPGAAQVMTFMSEEFGADMRLVAFMQFTRVIIVAGLAAAVARIWADTSGAGAPVPWFEAPDWANLAATLAVVAVCLVLHRLLKVPALAFVLPMIACAVLQDLGLLTIELPPLLLAVAYVAIGWGIGLRFDKQVLRHAARATPRILLSIFMLVAVCCGLAGLLVIFADVDPLTAYLAMSPGGADTVAIIAASPNVSVDVPFVMAMQIARFLLIVATGPALARFVSRRMGE